MTRLLMIACFVGCAGDAPLGSVPDDVDAPSAAIGKRLSGKALDYFDIIPMSDATITTDGIDPAKTSTTVADGSWSIEDIPIGSNVVLSVAHANYRTTRNVTTPVVDGDVVKDIFVISDEDVVRQYQAVAVTPTAGTGVLIAELHDDVGQPLAGVALTEIDLVDAANTPPAGISGPFVFGEIDLDPALTTTTTAGGRSRIAILDIPPGAFQLRVNFINAQQVPITATARVTATADGVVLALTGD